MVDVLSLLTFSKDAEVKKYFKTDLFLQPLRQDDTLPTAAPSTSRSQHFP